MGKMQNLYIDIQDEIDQGELTFQQIATKYGVNLQEVEQCYHDMIDRVDFDHDHGSNSSESYQDESYDYYDDDNYEYSNNYDPYDY